MKILYNYTTRSRRYNFLRGIDSIKDCSTNQKDYHILISVENEMHDNKMHPLPELNCPHTYKVNPGEPTDKVDAINRDLNEFLDEYDADIIVNMSDDMVFKQRGFDDIIRKYFLYEEVGNALITSHSLDRFLHFPDGNRGDLCTMSIIGRDYYNRDKYIYHPDYKSLWCDNEAQLVAQMRGCYVKSETIIFNHLHPAFAKGVYDQQYRETEALSGVDAETFRKRKANGFPN